MDKRIRERTIQKIIVGNKRDLEKDRKIGKDVIQKFCEENNIKDVEMRKISVNVLNIWLLG